MSHRRQRGIRKKMAADSDAAAGRWKMSPPLLLLGLHGYAVEGSQLVSLPPRMEARTGALLSRSIDTARSGCGGRQCNHRLRIWQDHGTRLASYWLYHKVPQVPFTLVTHVSGISFRGRRAPVYAVPFPPVNGQAASGRNWYFGRRWTDSIPS